MNVGVIGANGQLGTDLVRLVPEEIEIIPLTRKDVDITNEDDLEKLFEYHSFDVLINTAAFHETDVCENEVEKTFRVNTFAVKDIAELCREHSTKLVHISTDYVFGGDKDRSEPYEENAKRAPLNIYGLSKSSSEDIVRYILPNNHYICRISSVYGKAGSSGKGGNFVYTMLRLGEERDELNVIDDIIISPTYTYDAANLIWKLITDKMSTGTYHLSNKGSCSWFEFTKKIMEFAELSPKINPIPHTEYPTEAERPLYSVLKDTKGLENRTWQEGLRHFIQSLD